MSKVDIKRLDSVTNNDTTATTTINDNFENLQQAIEDSLSRLGNTPNFMDADLDMNSYRIINGAAPEDPKDFVTLEYVEEKIGNAAQYAEAAEVSAGQAKSYAQQALIANSQAQVSSSSAQESLNSVIALKNETQEIKDSAIEEINNLIEEAKESVATKINNITIDVDEWIDITNTDMDEYKAGYRYTAVKNIPEGSINKVPTVIFSILDATSGNFAPVCDIDSSNGLFIYAKEKPTETVTIDTLILQ